MAFSTLDAILSALGGGAEGWTKGKEWQQRQNLLEQTQKDADEERKDRILRRQAENLATTVALRDRGVVPAASADQVNLGSLGSVGSMAPGAAFVQPAVRVANPQKYEPVGSFDGKPYVFAESETKVSRDLDLKKAERAAKVARLVGQKKPDGSPVTAAEAESIVDGTIPPAQVFKERNIDPLSPEGESAWRRKAKYESDLVAAREAAARAAGRAPTQMNAEQNTKYLNDAAYSAVEGAAAQLGDSAKDEDIINRAWADLHTSKPGKDAVGAGLGPSHLYASLQRFKDRFTAKSKETNSNLDFLTGTGPSFAPPGVSAGAQTTTAKVQAQQGTAAKGNVDLSKAPQGRPAAPDSLLRALDHKHLGNVQKIRAELVQLGFDPDK